MAGDYLELYKQNKAALLGSGTNLADAAPTDKGVTTGNEGVGALQRSPVAVDNIRADARIPVDSALRVGQKDLHNLWTDYSQGKGPNVAQAQANIKMGDLIEQQAGAQQPGLASLAAARQGAGMGNSIVSNAATNRGKEQALSLGQMGQTSQQMANAEGRLMGLGSDRASAQDALNLASKQQDLKMYLDKMGLGQNYDKLAQEGRLQDVFASMGIENSHNAARNQVLGVMDDSQAAYDAYKQNLYKQAASMMTMGASNAAGLFDSAPAAQTTGPDYQAWKKEPGYDPRYGF